MMSEKDSMKERIFQYLEYKNIRKSEFERNINASNGYLNSMRKGLGVDKLELVRANYPDLNISWLKTGEGKMLKEDSNSTMIKGNYNNIGHGNNVGNNIVGKPSVYYAINQDQIKLMELEIESLKKQLEDKDRIIAAKDQTLKLYEKMIEK